MQPHGGSGNQGRIVLSLTVEDASYVEDALSYYQAAADNNFGAGYQRGGAGYQRFDEDEEQKRRYRRVEGVMHRLTGLLAKREAQ